MKLADRAVGVAPIIATSLTVPCTDRQPMSPPGKNSGEITWPSVAITRRWPGGTSSTAPSLPSQGRVVEGAGEQLLDQLRLARPPAPWFMSTRPCLKSSGRM
jgi:hypothetical protein